MLIKIKTTSLLSFKLRNPGKYKYTRHGVEGIYQTRCIEPTIDIADDSLPAIVPAGQHCVCTIVYQRYGPSCLDAQFQSPLLGAVRAPTILVYLFVSFYVLKNLVEAYSTGLLKPSPATTTIYLCLFSAVAGLVWTSCASILQFGSQSYWMDVNTVAISLTTSGWAICMSVVMLVWQMVLASSSKLSVSNGNSLSKILVISSSVFITSLVFALLLLDQSALVSLCLLVYYLGIFIVYRYFGHRMQKILLQGSGQAPDKKLQALVKPIQKYIKDVTIFILCFVPLSILYSIANNANAGRGVRMSMIPGILVTILQYLGAFLINSTVKYASGPLLRKIKAKKSTTVSAGINDEKTIVAGKSTIAPILTEP